MKDETEKCYLEYVEGYLTCTYNHEIAAVCLMDREGEEVEIDLADIPF